MGKSRLVAEVAAEVHASGGRVLLGACFEDVDEPYGPFVQAIVNDVDSLQPEAARARAGDRAYGARSSLRRRPAPRCPTGPSGPGTTGPSTVRPS